MMPKPPAPSLLLPALGPVLLLTSCMRLTGPTVEVAPAPGRPQAAFEADRRSCMATTDRALQPVADGLGRAPGGAGQFAASGARLQAMYNDAFGRCMAARGNVVATATAPDMASASSASGGGTPAGRRPMRTRLRPSSPWRRWWRNSGGPARARALWWRRATPRSRPVSPRGW